MKIAFAMLIPFALAISGCFSVHPIKILPGKGGIVEVDPGFKSLTDPAVQAEAMKLMEANCGFGRVKVIEEGYVKVGEKTETTGEESTKKHENKSHLPSKSKLTHGETKTVDINKWRISYECIKASHE
jgi:hypothetical protein